MKYRKLGASDLSVSEISLGSWLTFGVGVERDKAAACVDRAFDLGINFIDTANAYGRGAAENFLRGGLGGRQRPRIVTRANPQADRCFVETAARRLCRSLSVPSLRRRHPVGRDNGRAE